MHGGAGRAAGGDLGRGGSDGGGDRAARGVARGGVLVRVRGARGRGAGGVRRAAVGEIHQARAAAVHDRIRQWIGDRDREVAAGDVRRADGDDARDDDRAHGVYDGAHQTAAEGVVRAQGCSGAVVGHRVVRDADECDENRDEDGGRRRARERGVAVVSHSKRSGELGNARRHRALRVIRRRGGLDRDLAHPTTRR